MKPSNSRKNHKNKKENWRNHFHTYEQSGQTIDAYCKMNSLSLSTFKYWRTKLNKESVSHGSLIPVVLERATPTKEPSMPQFAPSGLGLHIDNRFTLEISQSFDQQTFLQLIDLLRQS